MLGVGGTGVNAFGCFVIVSWGELTSSKLQAPSYEKAGARILTTKLTIIRPLGTFFPKKAWRFLISDH